MDTNPVKTALASGGIVLGSEVSGAPGMDTPGIYARAGFSFVFIDMEHTTFSLETVASLVRATKAAGVTPIVRVPQGEYAFVVKVLECGADGVIVPRVNTAEEARRIVSWTRYPPYGIRGMGCTGGRPAPEFLERSLANTLVVIQIERQEAIDNLEEMLAVPGVDCACLGYMDLSVDLGIPGSIEHPRMVAAVERLIEVSDRCGVAPGFISGDLDSIRHWMGRGMRFISCANDRMLLESAAQAAMASLRPAAIDAGPHQATLSGASACRT